MPTKTQLEAELKTAASRIADLEEDNKSLRLALAEAPTGAASTPEYIRYAGTGEVEGGWASPGLVRKNPPMGALCVSHVVIDEAAYRAAPAHKKFGVRVRQAPLISSKKRE